MSRLLRRAFVNRENAEANYQKIALDDAYLDSCCFNLQQCIEFSLKYAVELYGQKYVENHDIRAQLNLLKKIGVEVPNADLLRQNAQTLTSWEASARYKDNFIALIEDVDIARKCADDLLSFLEKKTQGKEGLNSMSAFPDKKL